MYVIAEFPDPNWHRQTMPLVRMRWVAREEAIDEAVRRRTTREDRFHMLPEKRDVIGPYLLHCAAKDIRDEFRALKVLA